MERFAHMYTNMDYEKLFQNLIIQIEFCSLVIV